MPVALQSASFSRMPSTLRIAVLDADRPVPKVCASRGLYSDIFEDLFRDAASSLPEFASTDLIFTGYDCVAGSLPGSAQLSCIDALIITGSASSAYDNIPWIISLTQFIREIYATYPNIKIFGACFGHQILAHALFPDPKAVCRSPVGWELGVHAVSLSPAFISRFGHVKSNPANPSQMRIQFVHLDHVVTDGGLPSGFESIGSTPHCACQGLYERGRVLSFQGHVEFDRYVNDETLKAFGKDIWEKEFFERALAMVDADDDSAWAAQVVLKFMVEEGNEEYV